MRSDGTLRVLFVVTGFPLGDTPATGVFNMRTAQALSGASCEVRVVRLRGWRPFRQIVRCEFYDGIPVWTLAIPQVPGVKRTSVDVYKRLAWPFVRRIVGESDVVHSVGGSFAGLVAAYWAKRSGVRHVTQITSLAELDGTRLRPEDADMRFIHGVACNSQTLTKCFQALYPTAHNVRTVYRGVDLKQFHPAHFTRTFATRTPGVTFLFLGGFPDYKDLPSGRNTKGGETLLEAWTRAEDELAAAGARLVVAGPGSDDGTVQRWREGLEHSDRVQLIGTVPPDRVLNYIQASDVLLVPSLQEGFPNVALEASACGRGLLASAIDPIAELVIDGENGKLIPPGDAKSWQHSLIDFAQRRDDLRVFGDNARRRAERFFDARNYPAELISLYKAAMDEDLEETA